MKNKRWNDVIYQCSCKVIMFQSVVVNHISTSNLSGNLIRYLILVSNWAQWEKVCVLPK